MMYAPRTTCARCEQGGADTQLIPYGRGGLCPIHEADFIASITPQQPHDPLLRDVGIPGWQRRSG